MTNKTREIFDYVRRYRARQAPMERVRSGLASSFRYVSLQDAASTLTGTAIPRDQHPADVILAKMYPSEWGDYNARRDAVMESL